MSSLKETANNLSAAQRNMLLDHIDKRLPVVVGPRMATLGPLMNMKLVRSDPPGANRPQFTVLTEYGRQVVCTLLGMYADRLVQAGFLKERLNITENSRLPPLVALEMPNSAVPD